MLVVCPTHSCACSCTPPRSFAMRVRACKYMYINEQKERERDQKEREREKLKEHARAREKETNICVLFVSDSKRVYTRICIYTHICMSIHTYRVCKTSLVYIYGYAYIYIYVSGNMHTHAYIYTQVYIHTCLRKYKRIDQQPSEKCGLLLCKQFALIWLPKLSFFYTKAKQNKALLHKRPRSLVPQEVRLPVGPRIMGPYTVCTVFYRAH